MRLPSVLRDRRPILLGAIAAVVALAGASALLFSDSGDAESTSPEPLLDRLSADLTQGWLDEEVPLPTLARRFEQGERLYVTCGTLSRLAQQLLEEEGVDSRIVTTLTRRRFNGSDDGHTMIEVETADGWVLFDLASNRVAVDTEGDRIGFLEQVRAGADRRWEATASDKLIDFRGAGRGTREESALYVRDLRGWYERVLGTPMIETSPGSGRYAFRDPSQRRRVEAYSPAYQWASESLWNRLAEPR